MVQVRPFASTLRIVRVWVGKFLIVNQQIKEAIKFHLEGLREEGLSTPDLTFNRKKSHTYPFREVLDANNAGGIATPHFRS